MSEPDAPRPYPEGWPMPAEKPDPPPPAPPPPRDVPVSEAQVSEAPAVAPREAPTEAPRDAPGDLLEELPGSPEEDYHHPLDRVTGRLPRRTRIVVDWIVTIVGAVAIVLAIKAWVVNPYRIPSSSMEPTLHCARPAPGCEARFSDRVLANRFIYHFRDPKRGEIVVFQTTPAVKRKCNAGGTFVKRIVGLPGETPPDPTDSGPRVRLHQRPPARGAVHPGEPQGIRACGDVQGSRGEVLHDGGQPCVVL